jgi:CMP-N-acetylneuraminic acid synthetase
LKFCALIPMKHDSERVKGKNFRPFSGRPLFCRIIETVKACPSISQILVDTDSPLIKKGIKKEFPEVKIVDRPAPLCGGTVPTNAIIEHDLTQTDHEYFIQTHATNPLLKSSTLEEALLFFQGQNEFDSLFSVTTLHARLWNKDYQPINHDPRILLRTQDLPPVYEENSLFYIFSRNSFEKGKNRIGQKPGLRSIPKEEAMDIDEEIDFQMAEYFFQKGQTFR